ncbi:MAG: cytochrome c [Myxococcota bacterium]
MSAPAAVERRAPGSSPARAAACRRRVAQALAAALVLALLALVVVRGLSDRIFERRYGLPTAAAARETAAVFEVPIDARLLERGRHLVTEVAQCTFCHGPDLAGRELADDPWIGRLHASNLTRGSGGVGARLSDADWIAALRRGVASDGRSLLLMPSAGLARLGDRDLAAVVAYVRRVPSVDRVLPPRRVGWLTRLVVSAGLAPDLISAEQAVRVEADREAIEPAPTDAYGKYLVSIGGCRACHRADLGGGLHPLSLPGEPVPPDLTRRGGLAAWSLAEFARAMREGRTPDGRRLDRAFMPWPAFSGLEEVEIEAIWRYLQSVEAPSA